MEKVVFNLQTNKIKYKGIVEECLDNWVLVDKINDAYERQGWIMDGIVFERVNQVKEYFKNKIDLLSTK